MIKFTSKDVDLGGQEVSTQKPGFVLFHFRDKWNVGVVIEVNKENRLYELEDFTDYWGEDTKFPFRPFKGTIEVS